MCVPYAARGGGVAPGGSARSARRGLPRHQPTSLPAPVRLLAQGHTKTKGNFAKAAFNAIAKSYGYLTPDLWKETKHYKSPYQEHTDYLAKTHTARKSSSSMLAPRD